MAELKVSKQDILKSCITTAKHVSGLFPQYIRNDQNNRRLCLTFHFLYVLGCFYKQSTNQEKLTHI